MPAQVIVVIDVVGSTIAKEIYGETHAIKMIGAALHLAEGSLRQGDLALFASGPSAGDSILLIGGVNPVGVYHAAVVHQSQFIAWSYNRMPVKIAIGYGEFDETEDANGTKHLRGSNLDFLYRICDVCPSGGVVVSPSVYALLQEAGFGPRMIEVREELKGFGQKLFYESNGDYQIPLDQRQRTQRHEPPRTERARVESIKNADQRYPREPTVFVPVALDRWVLLGIVAIVLAILVYIAFHVTK